MLEQIWRDVRYALRMLGRSPGFSAVAVLSLALGIGANTAVFSLINALMLRLLPVDDPARLVELLQHYPGEPRGNGFWSWASYEHYRDHNRSFDALIAASAPARWTVRGEGPEAETVVGQSVSGNFFPELGIRPAIGRLIGPQDGPAVVVVSWAFWKSRFNLDPAIVGKQMILQDAPVTIAGVAPRAFTGLLVGTRTDLWLPLVPSPTSRLGLLAYLKPGVSIEQARAEMAVLYRFTVEERAANSKDPLVRQLKVEVEPAGAGLSLLRDRLTTPLFVLMAVVGLILLIACTNLAGLLLARAAARRKEMAIRVSLGASRLRLVRQVLTESLMLAGAGGLVGIVLAYFGASALVRILTSGRPMIGVPQPLEISLTPDVHVLLFTAGIAVLTGLLFGLAPAFLAQPARSSETRSRQRFGKALVAVQVALSVVVLSAAGLFVRHLQNLEHIDLGFQRDHVLLVSLDSPRGGTTPPQRYQELLGQLGTIPGVRSVSLSAPTPLSGAGAAGFATAEGFEERPGDRRYISVSWVAPRYFETLGTPLIEGREFELQDEARGGVAIINQAMARHYFSGRDPIGKHLTLDHITGQREPRSYGIVGIVGNAKYYEIREPAPRTVYLPAFENGTINAGTFVLRTYVDPGSVTGDVRHAVRDVLKTIPVARITTLSDQVDATIVPERLIATLSGLFCVLGSTLAAIGLYGLLAYTVTRRITEFGIRLALGATGRDLLRLVVRDAMVLVCAGVVLGAPVALWGTALASGFIHDPTISNAAPLLFGVAAMLALALIAAMLPARRAARVDPIEALRHE